MVLVYCFDCYDECLDPEDEERGPACDAMDGVEGVVKLEAEPTSKLALCFDGLFAGFEIKTAGGEGSLPWMCGGEDEQK